MPLSPPGDLYFGLNDAIFAKLLQALQAQRPSLLNYCTPYFASNPAYWCNPIPTPANGAPLFTAIPAIQYLGGGQIPSVEMMLQINDLAIGFGVDTVGLPPDMLPLPPQRIAVKISVNLRFAVPRLDPTTLGCPASGQQFGHATYPLQLCNCFNATIFTTNTAAILKCGADSWITFAFDRIESTNLTPPGLRDTMDYLSVLILDTMVVPAMWIKLAPFVIDLSKALPPTAPIKTITVAPSAPTANPNPDISGDLLQARFSLKVTAP
jgi:hypothetical protein